MTSTAHDSALRTERTLAESYWKLLLLLHEERLRFPIAISPERDSDHGPRLRVQVEECDFRDYFEQIDRRVMRTEDHEGAVHVHVAGICRGVPIHVIAVMEQLDKCRISVDGWCATHSSRRGAVYCVPKDDEQ